MVWQKVIAACQAIYDKVNCRLRLSAQRSATSLPQHLYRVWVCLSFLVFCMEKCSVLQTLLQFGLSFYYVSFIFVYLFMYLLWYIKCIPSSNAEVTVAVFVSYVYKTTKICSGINISKTWTLKYIPVISNKKNVFYSYEIRNKYSINYHVFLVCLLDTVYSLAADIRACADNGVL